STTLSAKDSGWTIDEVISYDLGAIDVGAKFWQFINLPNFGAVGTELKKQLKKYGLGGAETWEYYKVGIKGNLWGSYTFGAFVPKFEVYGGYGGISKDADKTDLVLKDDVSIFYIGGKPSITWNIAEGAKVVAAYNLEWAKAKLEPKAVTGVGVLGPASEPTALSHKVYVDFVWSF
ncbi:MAG: hypothetical protein LBO65_03580, partial [Spirochaetaceae bacterium]|nr:hypothetical protein [Spirochaetaceae bacterium]